MRKCLKYFEFGVPKVKNPTNFKYFKYFKYFRHLQIEH
jgi:hypothetical protein